MSGVLAVSIVWSPDREDHDVPDAPRHYALSFTDQRPGIELIASEGLGTVFGSVVGNTGGVLAVQTGCAPRCNSDSLQLRLTTFSRHFTAILQIG